MAFKKGSSAAEKPASDDRAAPVIEQGDAAIEGDAAPAADAVPSEDAAPVAPAAPAIADPVVALDAQGQERPLSGGSFIRIGGKLVRKEA